MCAVYEYVEKSDLNKGYWNPPPPPPTTPPRKKDSGSHVYFRENNATHYCYVFKALKIIGTCYLCKIRGHLQLSF